LTILQEICNEGGCKQLDDLRAQLTFERHIGTPHHTTARARSPRANWLGGRTRRRRLFERNVRASGTFHFCVYVVPLSLSLALPIRQTP
jgi:hypothetical protein